MNDPFAENPDLVACAELVRRGDPDRFAAVMAAPVQARALLFPVYAFNVEVSRAPWVTAEPMIAQMRLQWWADALEEIRAGGMVRRHEVVTPLALTVDGEGAEVLGALVEARRLDIERAPFDTQDALVAYLGATGGGLMVAAARALGDSDGRVAHLAGYAAGLAGYLRAVPALEARGKVPLADGRPEALVDLARGGLDRLAEARRLRGTMAPAARVVLAAAIAAEPVLRRVVSAPGRVAAGALTPSEGALRARRLWGGMTGRW